MFRLAQRVAALSTSLLLVGGCLLLQATSAFAFQLAPGQQTCTTLNCGSLNLPGRINGHPTSPAIANPWVGQIGALAGGCMRFHVITQAHDLAMSVVAPNGQVFTNDSGGVAACPACPRVVVANSQNGYYTVVISQRSGVAVEANFLLRAGFYSSGNAPNCSSPTPAG